MITEGALEGNGLRARFHNSFLFQMVDGVGETLLP
jgi:hypothetical protein